MCCFVMQGFGLDICKRTVSSLKKKTRSKRRLRSSDKPRRTNSSDSHASWTILSQNDSQRVDLNQKHLLSTGDLEYNRVGCSTSKEPSSSSTSCHSEKRGESVIHNGCRLLGSCFRNPCSPSGWCMDKNNLYTQRSAAKQVSSEEHRKRPVVAPPSRIPKASQIPTCPGCRKHLRLKCTGGTSSLLHRGSQDPRSKIPGPPKANMEVNISESSVHDYGMGSQSGLDSIFFYDVDYFQFMNISTDLLDRDEDGECSFSEDSFKSETASISSTQTESSVVEVIDKKMPDLPPMAAHQPTMGSRELNSRILEHYFCSYSRTHM